MSIYNRRHFDAFSILPRSSSLLVVTFELLFAVCCILSCLCVDCWRKFSDEKCVVGLQHRSDVCCTLSNQTSFRRYCLYSTHPVLCWKCLCLWWSSSLFTAFLQPHHWSGPTYKTFRILYGVFLFWVYVIGIEQQWDNAMSLECVIYWCLGHHWQ